MTDAEESIGDRIRQARERIRMPSGRRMTQGELAAAVGVERNTVSRWENGDVQPTKPAQLLRLARVLRVPTDWLIGGGAPIPTGGTQLGEGDPGAYSVAPRGDVPPAAASVVAVYLDRLARVGCTTAQRAAAESLFVAATRNAVSRTPLESRDDRDVVADADAAWDLIARILRRDGIRP
jgi:DNA-binding XRE family transcriptional regulator